MFDQLFLFTTTSWFLASLLLLPGFFLLVKSIMSRSSREVSSLLRKNGMKFSIFRGAPRWEQFFLAIFLVFFWSSFAFRLQPYGYAELVAFSTGPLLYFMATRLGMLRFFLGTKAGETRARQYFAGVVTLISGLISVHALVTFLFQHTPRLSGIFRGLEPFMTYPNTLAMFLIIVLPFQVYLFLKPRFSPVKKMAVHTALNSVIFSVLVRAAGGFFLVTNLMALVLTFSRGAYMAFVITVVTTGVAAFFVKLKKGRDARISFRAIGIIVMLLAAAFTAAFLWNEWHRSFQPPDLARQVPLTENIVTRVADQERSADQSSNERIEFWQGAWQLIKQYPWSGIGSDGFRFQYPRVQSELLALSDHPHNLFLKLAVENGIPCALFFGLFLAALAGRYLWEFFVGQKGKSLSGDNAGWMLAVFASFLAMNLHLMVDYNINAMFVWFFYWLILMFMGSSPPVVPRSRIFNCMVGMAMVGVLVISVISFFHYRQIKNAPAGNYHVVARDLFQPLVYEQMGADAQEPTLSRDQREVFKNQLAQALSRYPQWAELKIASARVFAAMQQWSQARILYAQALALNSLNNLDWHFEYLSVLRHANLADEILERESFYYDLMRRYLEKLRNDEHNTLATKNPKYGLEIIDFYLQPLPSGAGNRWDSLKQQYMQIYQEERSKFEQLYPEMKGQFIF